MEMISIVMPLYNAENFLSETIESVRAQTYADWELLICDDASTDRSLSILNKYKDKRIRLFKNKQNKGIAYTRNRLLDLAQGEYVAIWDDDDLCPANRFELEIKRATDEGTDIVVGHYERTDEAGKNAEHIRYTYLNPKYLRAYAMLNSAIPNGTAVVRKSFLDEKNIRYKEGMCGAEDYRFWCECMVKGASISIVDEVLLQYRVHQNNASMIAQKNNNDLRARVIGEIKKYHISNLGIRLADDEMDVLVRQFPENGVMVSNKGELELLYKALLEICRQSEKLLLDNSNEIRIMCRKRFGEKVGAAPFLWESDYKITED